MVTYEQVSNYNFVQTFYADPEVVNNSGEIAVTSVDLYFKSKPDSEQNTSGVPNPGVIVRICEVVNNQPDLSKVYAQKSFKSYSNIYAFADASSATSFGFSSPIKLPTGRFYGIVIIFEDPGFELWQNRSGDKLIGTTSASAGSNLVRDGLLFRYSSTTSDGMRPLSDSDLKFKLNVAQYVSNTYSEVFVSRNYEFFTSNTISGRFLGGENIYQHVANATGNVAFTANTKLITGVGTTFESDMTNGDKIVVFANSTLKQVVEVRNVVNNTVLETRTRLAASNTSTKFMVPPIGKGYWFRSTRRKLYLSDSSANTTLKFAANSNILEGEDSGATALVESIDAKSVDSVAIRAPINLPAAGQLNAYFTFSEFDGSDYRFSFDNSNTFNLGGARVGPNRLNNYDGYIVSRSAEVDNANLYSNTTLLVTRKSVVVNTNFSINLSNSELYQSPSIESGSVDMFTGDNLVSNTYTATDANSVTYDTEVAGEGLAVAKFYGKKISFANNRFAEDLRLFMTAYRPANTDIRVYARVHNSADPEAFDDKSWTPLAYKDNGGVYSSTTDRDDLVEYELGLSRYSETANVIPGSFTTELANNIIVAQGVDPTTYVAADDVVKVYNPLIPENYIIAQVGSANSTTITLGDNIANNNVVGSGYKVDRLKYYNIAFNNITTDNVARYFSSTLAEYDTFDTVQIKIVMLADQTYLVPEIEHYEVIGVSA